MIKDAGEDKDDMQVDINVAKEKEEAEVFAKDNEAKKKDVKKKIIRNKKKYIIKLKL